MGNLLPLCPQVDAPNDSMTPSHDNSHSVALESSFGVHRRSTLYPSYRLGSGGGDLFSQRMGFALPEGSIVNSSFLSGVTFWQNRL